MILMQRVQPEIKKIQQKYKDDRAKQNEELLKYYQENKINPLAGLPPAAVDPAHRYRGARHLPHARASSTTSPGRAPSPSSTSTSAATPRSTPAGSVARPSRRTRRAPCSFLGHAPQPVGRQRRCPSGVVDGAARTSSCSALVILTGWYQVRQTQARQTKSGGARAERADAGRHQDHADLLRGDLLRLQRRHDHLLRRLEHVAHRPAALRAQQDVRGGARRRQGQGRSHDRGLEAGDAGRRTTQAPPTDRPGPSPNAARRKKKKRKR